MTEPEAQVVEAELKQPWWKREAVRLRGYSVGVAVVGILTLREYLSNQEAAYLLMALAALLGVYGVESSRSRTVSQDAAQQAVEQTRDEKINRWPYPPDIRADDTPEDYPDDWQDDDPAGSGPRH